MPRPPNTVRLNNVLSAVRRSDGYHLVIPDHPLAHVAAATGVAVWRETGWVAPIVARSDLQVLLPEVRRLLRAIDEKLSSALGEDYPDRIRGICAARLDNHRKARQGTLQHLQVLIARKRAEAVGAASEIDRLRGEIAVLRQDKDQVLAGQDPDKPARAYETVADAAPSVGDVVRRGGHPVRVTHIGEPRFDSDKDRMGVRVFFDWAHDVLPDLRETVETQIEP